MKGLPEMYKDNGQDPKLALTKGKLMYDKKLGAKVWISAAELAEKGAK